MLSDSDSVDAEGRFREAFERLKVGKAERLKPGTPVSQNNVAKEAGCDPSALRKSRFPSLIREIQAYVELSSAHVPTSKRQTLLSQRKARADAKERLEEVEAQRDEAQSKLASAHLRIVELSTEVKLLKTRLDSLRPPPMKL